MVYQRLMSHYDEVERPAGKVGCINMTMKNNPSYKVHVRTWSNVHIVIMQAPITSNAHSQNYTDSKNFKMLYDHEERNNSWVISENWSLKGKPT